jgi:hypothetical protein
MLKYEGRKSDIIVRVLMTRTARNLVNVSIKYIYKEKEHRLLTRGTNMSYE